MGTVMGLYSERWIGDGIRADILGKKVTADVVMRKY
jgi:hypothetical protein